MEIAKVVDLQDIGDECYVFMERVDGEPFTKVFQGDDFTNRIRNYRLIHTGLDERIRIDSRGLINTWVEILQYEDLGQRFEVLFTSEEFDIVRGNTKERTLNFKDYKESHRVLTDNEQVTALYYG